MAIRAQLMKAKATEIWNLLHGRLLLQKCKSLEYRTIIPADEHAAASDKVAVTCKFRIITCYAHYYRY